MGRALMLVVGLWACGDDEAGSACLRAHPGDGAMSIAKSNTARASCAAEGGEDCSASGVISPEAAECIARDAGLAQGIAAIETSFVYNVAHERLIWVVQNTTHEEGVRRGGDSFSVDAKTGEVLDELKWERIP